MEEPTSPRVLLVADTREITAPAVVEDYSSHKLVWQSIHRQLAARPLSFNGDMPALLAEHAKPLGIDPASLPTPLFVDALITPAYEQGIARLLIAAGVAIDVAGRGWNDLQEFAHRKPPTIQSFESFERLIANYQTVVLPQALSAPHEADALPRNVVRTLGLSKSQLLSNLRKSIANSESSAWHVAKTARAPSKRLVA